MNQILSIVIVTLFLMSPTEAQTILIPKWEIGKTLNYEIEDNSNTKISGEDNELLELSMSLKLDTKWKVEKVLPDGSVELSVSIDRVRFSARVRSSDGGNDTAAVGPKLIFDSNLKDVPKVNPGKLVALVLNEYVGPVATVTIDRRGELAGFSASKDLAELWKDGSVTELAGFFGDIFMLDGVRNRLTAWLVEFPSDSVANGKTWHQKKSNRFGEGFASISNYKLIGPVVKDGKSLLQIELTSKIKEDTPPVPAPAETTEPALPTLGALGVVIEQKITMNEGSGQIFLDDNTRHIRKFVLRQQFGIKDSFSDNESKFEYSVNLRQGEHVGDKSKN